MNLKKFCKDSILLLILFFFVGLRSVLASDIFLDCSDSRGVISLSDRDELVLYSQSLSNLKYDDYRKNCKEVQGPDSSHYECPSEGVITGGGVEYLVIRPGDECYRIKRESRRTIEGGSSPNEIYELKISVEMVCSKIPHPAFQRHLSYGKKSFTARLYCESKVISF